MLRSDRTHRTWTEAGLIPTLPPSLEPSLITTPTSIPESVDAVEADIYGAETHP